MSRLLRTCAVFCVLAVSSLTVASAQNKNIDFHNGWIQVTNRSDRNMNIYVLANPWEQTGHLVWEGHIGAGVNLNNCCYAAGSLYMFVLHVEKAPPFPNVYLGMGSLGDIRPRLCNRNGIPFGYAAVEVFANHIVRTDTKCP